MKQLEDMIKLTIEDTIRRQLPIKEILKEHLETYDEPKQSSQKPLDMQMIMDELKKANLQKSKEEPEEQEEQEEQGEKTYVRTKSSESSRDIWLPLQAALARI